jgi:hypothetical protein
MPAQPYPVSHDSLGTHLDWQHEGVTPRMIDWFWSNMEKAFILWHPEQHEALEWAVPPKNGNPLGVQTPWAIEFISGRKPTSVWWVNPRRSARAKRRPLRRGKYGRLTAAKRSAIGAHFFRNYIRCTKWSRTPAAIRSRI